MNKLLFFILFFVCINSIQSQNYADKNFYLTDSLKLEPVKNSDRILLDSTLTLYHQTENDSLRLIYLSHIILECYSDDIMNIYNEIVKKTINQKYKKTSFTYKHYLAGYYSNLGYIFDANYKNDSALFYYKKALALRKKLPEITDVGTSLLQIGRVYSDNNQLKKALVAYKEAVSYLEKTTDYNSIAIANQYIFQILFRENKAADAKFFIEKAIINISKTKDVKYNLLGSFYNDKTKNLILQKEYNNALNASDTAILFLSKANDIDNLSYSYIIKGRIHRALENRKKEKEYNDKALEIIKTLNRDDLYGTIYSSISKYYNSMNDINKAEKFALKSLFFSKKIKNENALISDYELLEEINTKKQNYKKAYHYSISKQELIDKKNKEKENAILKYKIEYDFEQEKKHNDIVHQKEIELADAEKQKSFYTMLAFGLISFLIAIFSVYTFKQLNLIKKQKNQLEESKKNELAVSNLKALKSQMNPHFIFNLLNSIQYMVLEGDIDNSYNFINKFANLVRSTLDYSDKEKILLSEEIKLLEVYLKLEQLRFQDSLEYEFIKTDIREVLLPPMLIQPFIENALIHGLLHKKGMRKLKISFKVGKTVECIVEDNGIGRTKSKEIKDRQKSKHKSFSTEAIKKRFTILQDYYKEYIGYEYIDLEPNKDSDITTRVIIHIPYDEIKESQ